MRRRDLIAMLGGAAVAWPRAVRAESAPERPLIAILFPSTREAETEPERNFRNALKDAGYIEGVNLAIAARYANGNPARLAPLASELAALKPRVLISATDAAVLAAHRAAPSVPLVAILIGDPVGLGLARSYAHPGGVVTGLISSGNPRQIAAKRLAVFKEMLPSSMRFGLIFSPDLQTDVLILAGVRDAAEKLSLSVTDLPVKTADDFPRAFASGSAASVDAYYVPSASPLVYSNRSLLAQFALRIGKPIGGNSIEFARAGMLMSYGPDLAAPWRGVGDYTAKILSGVKPGDLPIVQPTIFRFVINLTTAKVLGITIPPTLLARADEVID